jgi:hypothetical protein
VEQLQLNRWSELCLFNAVKELLRDGMHHHLRCNNVLRGLLGLRAAEEAPKVLPPCTTGARHLPRS